LAQEALRRSSPAVIPRGALIATGECIAQCVTELQTVQRNQGAASPDAERLKVVEQEIARMETTIK
jgi:hypothetical protein